MNYGNLTLEGHRKLSKEESSKVPRYVLERLFDELCFQNDGWVYDQQRAKKLNEKIKR